MAETGDCEDCGGDAGHGECGCFDDGDSPEPGVERFAENVEPGRAWCRAKQLGGARSSADPLRIRQVDTSRLAGVSSRVDETPKGAGADRAFDASRVHRRHHVPGGAGRSPST